ncbi:MAG: prepilin peptidase [Novosphingobium sp.]
MGSGAVRGHRVRCEIFTYGLIALLAIALLYAALTDLKRRQIDNTLNASIAIGAPVFWWASGLPLSADLAWQLGVAALTFAITAALFAMRAMGGGDVKLLTVLALWFKPEHFFYLVVIMSVLGGLLTIGFASWHYMRRHKGRIAIPYGVAISSAALITLTTKTLPMFLPMVAPIAGPITGTAG